MRSTSLIIAGTLFTYTFNAPMVMADDNEPLPLVRERIKHDEFKPPVKKSPIQIPIVYQDGTTLTFASPCAGCTLQLLDEDGEIIYETEVPEGATSALLPDESGVFELRLVYEGYYFYAEIML